MNDKEQLKRLSEYIADRVNRIIPVGLAPNSSLAQGGYVAPSHVYDSGREYVLIDSGSKPDVTAMKIPSDREKAEPITVEVENGRK